MARCWHFSSSQVCQCILFSLINLLDSSMMKMVFDKCSGSKESQGEHSWPTSWCHWSHHCCQYVLCIFALSVNQRVHNSYWMLLLHMCVHHVKTKVDSFESLESWSQCVCILLISLWQNHGHHSYDSHGHMLQNVENPDDKKNHSFSFAFLTQIHHDHHFRVHRSKTLSSYSRTFITYSSCAG